MGRQLLLGKLERPERSSLFGLLGEKEKQLQGGIYLIPGETGLESLGDGTS